MQLIEKTKKFLTIGAVAISPFLGISIVGDVAPQGSKTEGLSIMADFKNGIDTIAYKSMGVALTQPTESYRFNIMEHLIKGRGAAFGFYVFTNDTEKEITKNNLEKAQKLGVFKDKDAFDAEVALLKAAEKHDMANDRLFMEDNGIIDISDPSHFQGVKNIEQVKKRVGETLASLRNTDVSDESDKLRM